MKAYLLHYAILISVGTVNGLSFRELTDSENAFIRRYCGLRGNQLPSPASHFKVNPARPTSPVEFLWTVYLRLEVNAQIFRTYLFGLDYYFEPATYTTQCTGILISTRHILTAAHCIFGRVLFLKGKDIQEEGHTKPNPRSITAYYGAGGTGKRAVRVDYFHSGAENKIELLAYDYAILELVTDIDQTDIEMGVVRPICFTDAHLHFTKKPRTYPPPPFWRDFRYFHKHPLTGVAGYGGRGYDADPGVYKTMWYGETRQTTCPPGHSPTLKCYKPEIGEAADSGTGFFRYDENDKAHLTAILSASMIDEKRNLIDRAVDALPRPIDAETDSQMPLNKARELINLRYSTIPDDTD